MEIFVVFILTLLNGVFALSEIALVSLKKSRIEYLARQGSRRAAIVSELLNEPENFLSSIQVGITLIGVVAGAYGGATLAGDVEPWLLKISWLAPYAEKISIIVVIALITYFTIVIGELIPKTIALRNAEKVALNFAPFIKYFTKITFPIVRLLSVSTTALLRLLGIRESKEEEAMTEEELRLLIKVAGTQGILEVEESQIHQNIFFFTEQRARNLRIHRTEVDWIDINLPAAQIKQLIQESAHSRFLACDGYLDNIVGIMAAKDFFEQQASGGDIHIRSIVQAPLYVPETMYALDVLKLFKRDKQYMAIVVDEFGSFEGILTLHDLMEAIVGDLPDLYEEEEPEIIARGDQSFLVNGSIPIHDLNIFLDRTLITENVDQYSTLAGFIIYHLSKIPDTGEKFTYNGYTFEIVDLDGQRIDKIILEQNLAVRS